ncbi:chemotaxis signal transduction protein CheW [Halosimplex carlsbadense 2-9-1]|uniref:Chemotaxis signal transduction protein CheW n=1 Tax=Halosimplex carlsbadense 2-9-1 TaxID=797114 RepID=M0CJ24_9EURY|nr:chemotaxis protein CheW [Halosimplex carlsbadense]ELZ22367.1 chemotaxis signal transduction protein CheW [Halosimplex carlsbadense 2-9-1]
MTDDERMDRARRIREMREGSRPDDEAQGDDQDDADEGSPDGAGDADDDQSTADEPTVDEPAEPAETEADGGPEADDDSGEPAAADDPGESAAAGEATETADDAVSEAAAEAVADLNIDEGAVGGGGDADTDDGDGTMHIPGADVGDVDVDVAEMARQAGLSAADSAAGDDAADDTEAAEMGIGAAGRAAAAEQETGEETRVLEFALGDEQYCLDIEYVEEIVKRETVTRVPNTPDCVEGVVDLRGQITTILDPKILLDIDEAGSKDLIVVFDPDAFDDQGAVGWVVDDVNQVTPITEDEVNDSPVDQDHINGVVDRDGEFVIWTTPELDLDEVAG